MSDESTTTTDTTTFVPLREQGGKFAHDNRLEDKPVTEQILFKAQDEWLTTRSPEAWETMHMMLYQYSQSLVKKKLMNKAFLDPQEITDIASEATINFMTQYLRPSKTGHFEVGRSFAAMLNFKVMEALYKRKPDDREISLNTVISDTNSELMETIGHVIMEQDILVQHADDMFQINIKDIINDITKEFIEVVDSSYLKTLGLLYLTLLLRRPKNKFVFQNFIRTWVTDHKHKQVLDLIELELYERLGGNRNGKD